MIERIGRELIEEGIKSEIITSSIEDDTPVIRIGDGWFYLSVSFSELQSRGYTRSDLVDMIYDAVNSEPINGETDDEASGCLYYKFYLEEQLGSIHYAEERRMQALENGNTVQGELVIHYNDDEYRCYTPVRVAFDEMVAAATEEDERWEPFKADDLYLEEDWEEIVVNGEAYPIAYDFDPDGIAEAEEQYGKGGYILVMER